MKLYELINAGIEKLESCGVPDADIDADILWQYVSGMDRLDILMAKGDEVNVNLESRYDEVIDRRCTRVPLQYITGTQNFMGYDFDTSENVLIPRQDTETLVETALKLTAGSQIAGQSLKPAPSDGQMAGQPLKPAPLDGQMAKPPFSVLDMCCGSGCIGISYGLMNKDSRVTLADISDAALELTCRNRDKLCGDKDRFSVVKSNLFDDIEGKFDLIMSNPPYIRTDVIDTLMPEVRDNEPRLALDGTEDGLYFYRMIVDRARNYIKDEGYVVFEIGNDQAEDVQYLFVDSGYDDIHVVQDLSHNDRVVYGRYRT